MKSTSLSLFVFLLLPAAVSAQDTKACQDHCEPAPLVENRFWTSAYGPAQANVVESGTNFLLCQGNRFALCYYSGPDREQMPPTRLPVPELTCVTDPANPGSATCECYAFDQGSNYVDIHSITNTEAYVETVRACGVDGSQCRNMVSDLGCRLARARGDQDGITGHCDLPTAPVCSYLGDAHGGQDLVPGADRLSTFSFDHVARYYFGSSDCTAEDDTGQGQAGLYAGCMTAPCIDYTGADGTTYSRCQCPTYDGPYQVGQQGATCPLSAGYVWSAAYTPPSQQSGLQATLKEAGGIGSD